MTFNFLYSPCPGKIGNLFCVVLGNDIGSQIMPAKERVVYNVKTPYLAIGIFNKLKIVLCFQMLVKNTLIGPQIKITVKNYSCVNHTKRSLKIIIDIERGFHVDNAYPIIQSQPNIMIQIFK